MPPASDHDDSDLRGPPGAVWEGLRRFAKLPAWLDAGVRPDQVRIALIAAVPELADGTLTLADCRVKRPRLDHGHWTATYLLTIREPGQPPHHVALSGHLYPLGPHPQGAASAGGLSGGVHAFGAPDWRIWLPGLDLELRREMPEATLPALADLTEPARGRRLIERAIRAGAPAYRGIEIAACTPTVLRQHLGRGGRATIACQLTYPPSVDPGGRGWPSRVIAKVYADDNGRHAAAAMRALWSAGLPPAVVTLAEPLAYLPDLRLLVQGSIPAEQTLDDLLRAALRADNDSALAQGDAQADAAVERTAAALAALHSSGVGRGPRVTVEHELDGLAALSGRLAELVPELDGAADALLGWARALATRAPADPAVPTHRSFHPGQVLLHQGRVGIIDFDDLCQAEPALDVAQFRATTKYLALAVPRPRTRSDAATASEDVTTRLGRLAAASQVCDRFQRRYAEVAPVSAERVALWETLHLFTYVLHCWTGVRPHRLHATMFLLGHHLLASGMAA